MPTDTGSVGKRIARLLRIPLDVAEAMMPQGEHSHTHVVGGYTTPADGKSELQESYERDTEGWDVIWTA